MSHLPEKGEAERAAQVLNERLMATGHAGDVNVVEVNTKTGTVRGASNQVLGAYGDLLDVPEVALVSEGPVLQFIGDIANGVDPEIALRSLFILATAYGVLMERARWSR